MIRRWHHSRPLRGLSRSLALGLALVLVGLMALPAAAQCGRACCAPAPAQSAGHMAGQMPAMASDQTSAGLSSPGCCCGSADDVCSSQMLAGQRDIPELDQALQAARTDLAEDPDSNSLFQSVRISHVGHSAKSNAPPRAGPIYLTTLALLI